ncbi:MAG: hypothetical protein HYV07_07750 [Deltaproteobacteria bacterium]|nr:hypothetical protein [Deltaproteobacteria bacterium]
MNWKRRVSEKVVETATKATKPWAEQILQIEYDALNALVRIVVPEDFDDNVLDTIRKAINAKTKIGVVFDGVPTYPYTTHFGNIPPLVVQDSVSQGPLEVTIREDEIGSLALAYDQLALAAGGFDRCITFALGGLPAMYHISAQTKPGSAFSAADARYHVFPSLTWEAKNPTPSEMLHNWLAAHGAGRSVMILDTTFSGGGTKKIRAFCEKYAASGSPMPSRIEIHCVFDLSRGHTPLTPDCWTLPGGTPCRLIVHEVPRLFTEDVNALIGYDSLRTQPGLEPKWKSAVITVLNNDGEVTTKFGTSNAAYIIHEQCLRFRPRVALDKSFADASDYMARLTALENARGTEVRELEKAQEKGLLLDGEFDRERENARKRYAALKARLRTKAR